jgi:hypothetical protein
MSGEEGTEMPTTGSGGSAAQTLRGRSVADRTLERPMASRPPRSQRRESEILIVKPDLDGGACATWKRSPCHGASGPP